MMNGVCRDMQERIADHVLGALDADQAQALRAHLDGCPACRDYLAALEAESQALVTLGAEVDAGMAARRDRALAALDDLPGVEARSARVVPWLGRHGRTAVAAALILIAGVTLGRLTGPRSVDVEQLRADLESSMDQRLGAVLATREAQLTGDMVEQVRREFRVFATEFASNSGQLMDRRLGELVQLIEAARLTDRQRVAKALEQVEQNRLRDKTQISLGLQSLVARTTAPAAPTRN